MRTVKQILAQKSGNTVWSVAPTTTTYDAVKLMAERSIGAVPVIEGNRLVGMFSERDYARKVVLQGKSSLDTPVGEIMSPKVFTITLHDTNDYCMQLMTDHRVRHLPVMEGEQMVGILSIGDLVKDIISEQKEVIEQLEHYIHS